MRLPFYYGWTIVAVTFVTMAIGVNARTAFSLFFPPIIGEFGWERGVTAGAFSFGFVVSAIVSPLIGRMMDRFGPRGVMETRCRLDGRWPAAGAADDAALASVSDHRRDGRRRQRLPRLFRPIVVSCRTGSFAAVASPSGFAFAGVGIGSVTLLPWVQHMIEQTGWRTACTAMGILVLVAHWRRSICLLRKKPEDIGLLPDGDAAPTATSAKPVSNIVDPVWAATDWTLARALRTARFWWIALGYFGGLYIWYAVQVHQTKFLLDIGFSANVAVWALGVVSLLGIPGQIWLGTFV